MNVKAVSVVAVLQLYAIPWFLTMYARQYLLVTFHTCWLTCS